MGNLVTSKEYDYFERKKVINALCKEYGFIKSSVIGKSCGGKDIQALRIGSSDTYCLIAAAFHGSERITATVTLMYIEELCRAIKNDGFLAGIKVRKALTGRGVLFVPCVNPDGCDISLLGAKACGSEAAKICNLCKGDFAHWNANLRGVDINHNFDAGWEALRETEKKNGILGPGPTRYGGERPHSEPETKALVELCKKTNIRHCMALHSQGEVIYWNFGDRTPPKARKMAEIMATSSGYALDAPIALATGGGFKDWFIKEFAMPGFTVEIGKGRNPLPAETAYDIYSRIREMLVLYTVM